MLLILFLSQHLFVTSLQGRVLPNFEEESSRPVIPQLLARSVEELNRWLVLAPMMRASSFYDPGSTSCTENTRWGVDGASPTFDPVGKERERDGGVVGAWREGRG